MQIFQAVYLRGKKKLRGHNAPEDVERAAVVDLDELVRRGETTRAWIQVALPREADTQACPWWEMREAPAD